MLFGKEVMDHQLLDQRALLGDHLQNFRSKCRSTMKNKHGAVQMNVGKKKTKEKKTVIKTQKKKHRKKKTQSICKKYLISTYNKSSMASL